MATKTATKLQCQTNKHASVFARQNDSTSKFSLFKVWSMLHHGVRWVCDEKCYFMLSSTSWHFLLFFYYKICFITWFLWFFTEADLAQRKPCWWWRQQLRRSVSSLSFYSLFLSCINFIIFFWSIFWSS